MKTKKQVCFFSEKIPGNWTINEIKDPFSLVRLATSSNVDIREAIVVNPYVPLVYSLKLTYDKDEIVRHGLAWYTKFREVLEVLLVDDSIGVRSAAQIKLRRYK